MKLRALALLLAISFSVALGFGLPAAAQESGRVEGTVSRADGEPVPGVAVVIAGAGATVTDSQGRYAIDGVSAGSHTVSFTLGTNVSNEEVSVAAGETAEASLEVDWDPSFVETITVFSASRRAERIVDAPAAVTVITQEEVARQASHGQVPKLLEFTPGAEVTQSGIYDYNFNTRGFNSSLNRRVATLIDGRNPAVPFLGAQEWSAVSFPLDSLANVELVRGPSAALYGANASSGVLNLVTQRPRDSQGGKVRVSAGELSTLNADARWAGALVEDSLYLKVEGGVRNSGDFTRSRNVRGEYAPLCGGSLVTDCLPREVVPLDPEDDNEITFGSARLDKYLGTAGLLTFEGGLSDVSGPGFQTGIGRVQLQDVVRDWARFNLNYPRFNLLGYYNKRDASKQRALASGANLALNTDNWRIEGQTNWDFANGDARIVAGASYGEESIDSFDPATGRQTLVFQPIDSDNQAVFGQLEWALGEQWKVVLAGRWDDSTLHDSQFSPKAAVVYSVNPNNSFRLTYNEAFQVANYSEFFLQAPVAPPVDLSLINLGVCVVNGFDCGLGITPVLALGNEDLELEEVKTIELGYNAIFGTSTFLTIDYYNSQNENFITDLISQVGTSLGRVNPNFGPYQPPAGLPAPIEAALLATLQGALGPSFFILSNNLDGSPILAAVSYTNFGEVDTQGIDLGINHTLNDNWRLDFTYSWFDFDIKSQEVAFENILLPNSPENKIAASLTFAEGPVDVSVSGRWVDDFRWAVGPFQGDVEAYYTMDVNGNYRINDNWAVGVTLSNFTDNKHWESWGGDLLSRRALGNVSFTW